MKTLRSAEANGIVAPRKSHASSKTNPGVLSEMKARQSAKIQDLGQALIDAGLRTLDAQADALGLRRSTAWTILKTCHKGSGLSAPITERMLGSSELPPRARAIIVEYVEEKSFGLYGGSRRQQQRFAVRLFNILNHSSISQEAQKASVETARRPGRAPAPARAAEPGLRHSHPGCGDASTQCGNRLTDPDADRAKARALAAQPNLAGVGNACGGRTDFHGNFQLMLLH